MIKTLKFAFVQEEIETKSITSIFYNSSVGQIWNSAMLGWGIKQLSTEFSVKMNHCFVNIRLFNFTPLMNFS